MEDKTFNLVRITDITFSKDNPLEVISAKGEKLCSLPSNYTENDVWKAYKRYNRNQDYDNYFICKFDGDKYLETCKVIFDFGDEDEFIDRPDPTKDLFASIAFANA